MDNYDKLVSVWGDVTLPVLVLEETADGYKPVCQNRAADLLCQGASLMDFIPEEIAARLTAAGSCPDTETVPFFCFLNGCAYSLVPFAWKGRRICMLHNVNEYYQENRRTLNDAIMANKAKTSFLSEMSHDIRTPMGAIIGMTDIALMQEDIPARVKECLNKIKVASGHMMSLLNEVLDMSRIESGRILLQEEDVDLADLLHEVLTVIRPQADAGKLHFSLKLGQMAEERLRGDSVRLKQICINLLSNAVKFTPAGGDVEMTVEVVPAGEPNRVFLKLKVQDNGIGMSQEFLQRIFVAFEREEKSTTNKIQGTGLGMAITKNLVELMGGTITVESRIHEGSCFFVEIPFTASPDQEERHRRALSGRRVLLFNDRREQVEQICGMLGLLGISADVADSADAAVDLINDMAFSDEEYFALLTAEKVNGVEMLLFLPQVRQRMGADFPILLLSEGDWSQMEYVYTRAGVDAFIPLPLFRTRLSAGLYAFTEEAKQLLSEDGGQRWNFRGKRILLAEDNEINREIALELLGMANLQIETVENGREAVERFAETSPDYYDMILMDIQMPVMNGLDATRAIRALDCADAQDIPIVAMTANAFVEDVKNSLDAGMNAHIAKPLDMNQVYSTLDYFLGRGGR